MGSSCFKWAVKLLMDAVKLLTVASQRVLGRVKLHCSASFPVRSQEEGSGRSHSRSECSSRPYSSYSFTSLTLISFPYSTNSCTPLSYWPIKSCTPLPYSTHLLHLISPQPLLTPLTPPLLYYCISPLVVSFLHIKNFPLLGQRIAFHKLCVPRLSLSSI